MCKVLSYLKIEGYTPGKGFEKQGKKESKKEVKNMKPKELQDSDKLTKHFRYGEMIQSQTAKRRDIDNTPTEEHLENFVTLCEEVLEPIRTHYNKPVIITSGYRSDELNAAIGGVADSQHAKGEAADFHVPSVDLNDVFEWIVTQSDILWDQIILEFYDEGGGWIHISYTERRGNRGEILTVTNDEDGSTLYEAWTEQEVNDGKHLEVFS